MDRVLSTSIDKGDKNVLIWFQGLDGPPGIKGEKGIVGFPGLRGDSGRPGPPGEKGVQGMKGTQGLPGLIGQEGLKGIVGDLGPKGLPQISDIILTGMDQSSMVTLSGFCDLTTSDIFH
ncbi:hypothetical protein XENORESO_002866 [Xenotaenia resolanae]|uniref:Uncharacterized protein n=1 Tax=Xenotaenia resolanae TaxID=208358 RepID=A0ABV0WCN8_9TELE